MNLTDVYNPEAYQARVNYAVQCIMRGIQSRRFDTCFEMSDGDAVVTAIVRRARKNPKLREALARQWQPRYIGEEGLPVSWVETAEKYADVSTRDLPTLARTHRERASAEFDKMMEELKAKKKASAA